MDALTFLKQHVPLFAGVSDELLTLLAQSSSLNMYKKGQIVLFKGATVDGLHVVAVGKVSVHAKGKGKELVQVAQLGTGEVFGETSVIEMGTAGALIKADDDGTAVLFVPQDAFRRLLAEDAGFVTRVKALIASRKAPSAPPA